MSLRTADNGRDTPLAWVFVAVQFVLLVLIVVFPPGDAWSRASSWSACAPAINP